MILALGVAWAACPPDTGVARWRDSLGTAESAFVALDTAGFQAGVEAAQREVGCLTEPLEPGDAVRFHLLLGLAIYTRGNAEDARLSFAAARAVDPGATLDFALVPEGHEVHDLVAGARVAGETRTVAAPEAGRLLFDGRATLDRPADRPTLAQWIAADAAKGDYLDIDEVLFDYPTKAPAPGPAPVPGPAPAPVPGSKKRGLSAGRVVLLAGSAVALGTSGVLYGVGAQRAAALDGPHDPSVTLGDLEAMRTDANRWVVGSGVAAGVGLVGAVGFAVVR
ncbi:MAG: hypothetical protein H6737_31570 [Alphaproteobacteria bacterium]|nr:hypothetical protein [Alphaproteobacteria bacterium]